MEEALIGFMLADTQLALLVSNRIDWQTRPQGSALPSISLQRVSGVRDYAMQGPTGLVASRVQIDCWGSTYASALGVARAVRDLLSGIRRDIGSTEFQGAFIDSERHGYEKDGNAADAFHRVSMDFQIWHTE